MGSIPLHVSEGASGSRVGPLSGSKGPIDNRSVSGAKGLTWPIRRRSDRPTSCEMLHKTLGRSAAALGRSTRGALELFLDLCFAVTLAQAGVSLLDTAAAGHAGAAALRSAGVLLAVWWAWMDFGLPAKGRAARGEVRRAGGGAGRRMRRPSARRAGPDWGHDS
ncbi:low temperature requirement protein A [Streptomyces sp. NPDC020490]|uniref:low temperature requirement protein A n=1 Tax=Streptomyces sp. NPDC020490 TaxID=3365078 RepID=UPI00378EBAE7